MKVEAVNDAIRKKASWKPEKMSRGKTRTSPGKPEMFENYIHSAEAGICYILKWEKALLASAIRWVSSFFL